MRQVEGKRTCGELQAETSQVYSLHETGGGRGYLWGTRGLHESGRAEGTCGELGAYVREVEGEGTCWEPGAEASPGTVEVAVFTLVNKVLLMLFWFFLLFFWRWGFLPWSIGTSLFWVKVPVCSGGRYHVCSG